MNYEKPAILHQYDKLGRNYMERQAINRKVKGWAAKINRLPAYQKHLLIQALINNDYAAVKHFTTVAAGNDKKNCG